MTDAGDFVRPCDYADGWDDSDELSYDEPDEDLEHEIGCDFPGQCLMPGEHMRSECHTVEMMEDRKREGLAEQLGFYIERQGGAHLVRYTSGGCRPASEAEIALWNALWDAT